ncbi:MAG: hypothetical protein Q8W51_07325 [Candidatus Palauibacterales bacterium]|nr:hypothetical protein [Candidatus Palauibacterales bacterium]MDP2529533.1 hypothetical protein [Candidatus Palauibacterales bacterium]MDP2582515.1 hypothetical protein [Candidatus Palauibacterales bacterium]
MNFNAAHLHIMLNHFPIVGVFAGTGLLTLWLLWRKEGIAVAGLWTLVGSGLSAVPVYILGNEAEDVVENMPGITHAAIERHQEAALWVLIGLLVLAVLSAWILWRRRAGRVPRGPILAVWVLALVASGITAWAAELGGEIHHPEIRPGWMPPAGTEKGAPAGEEGTTLTAPGVRLPASAESRSA